MKRNFFIFCANLLLLFLFFNNVFANSSDPKKFIQEIVDEVKKILVDTNSQEFKTKKLTEIATIYCRYTWGWFIYARFI